MGRVLALLGLVGALVCQVGASPAAAEPTTTWAVAPHGDTLVAPGFWTALDGASLGDGTVLLAGEDAPDGTPVLRWAPAGAQLSGVHDFRLVTTLQADGPDRAALALLDVPTDASEPSGGRVEVGFEAGQAILAVFDPADPTTPRDTQRVSLPLDPTQPTPLAIVRDGANVHLELAGGRVASVAAPDLFGSGRLQIGARVAAGTALRLLSLDVLVPAADVATASVGRCTPPRLLIASSEASTDSSQLAWVSLDESTVTAIEVRPNQLQRSYLVGSSPDGRWVTYYQRSASGPSDRFVVDTWVLDPASDARYRLVEGNAPIGWSGDSQAVVLGERPYLMATVPTGELVPTAGTLVGASSMRTVVSPDHAYRATVASMPNGAAGVSITDASGELVQRIPTGRGAVQLAWAPDSTRLAYTSGTDTASGLDWRLRVVDLRTHEVSLVEPTRQLEVHSVLWLSAAPECPSPGPLRRSGRRRRVGPEPG